MFERHIVRALLISIMNIRSFCVLCGTTRVLRFTYEFHAGSQNMAMSTSTWYLNASSLSGACVTQIYVCGTGRKLTDLPSCALCVNKTSQCQCYDSVFKISASIRTDTSYLQYELNYDLHKQTGTWQTSTFMALRTLRNLRSTIRFIVLFKNCLKIGDSWYLSVIADKYPNQ